VSVAAPAPGCGIAPVGCRVAPARTFRRGSRPWTDGCIRGCERAPPAPGAPPSGPAPRRARPLERGGGSRPGPTAHSRVSRRHPPPPGASASVRRRGAAPPAPPPRTLRRGRGPGLRLSGLPGIGPRPGGRLRRARCDPRGPSLASLTIQKTVTRMGKWGGGREKKRRIGTSSGRNRRVPPSGLKARPLARLPIKKTRIHPSKPQSGPLTRPATSVRAGAPRRAARAAEPDTGRQGGGGDASWLSGRAKQHRNTSSDVRVRVQPQTRHPTLRSELRRPPPAERCRPGPRVCAPYPLKCVLLSPRPRPARRNVPERKRREPTRPRDPPHRPEPRRPLHSPRNHIPPAAPCRKVRTALQSMPLGDPVPRWMPASPAPATVRVAGLAAENLSNLLMRQQTRKRSLPACFDDHLSSATSVGAVEDRRPPAATATWVCPAASLTSFASAAETAPF